VFPFVTRVATAAICAGTALVAHFAAAVNLFGRTAPSAAKVSLKGIHLEDRANFTAHGTVASSFRRYRCVSSPISPKSWRAWATRVTLFASGDSVTKPSSRRSGRAPSSRRYDGADCAAAYYSCCYDPERADVFVINPFACRRSRLSHSRSARRAFINHAARPARYRRDDRSTSGIRRGSRRSISDSQRGRCRRELRRDGSSRHAGELLLPWFRQRRLSRLNRPHLAEKGPMPPPHRPARQA